MSAKMDAEKQLNATWKEQLDALCAKAEVTQGAFHYAGVFLGEFRALMASALLRRQQRSSFRLGVNDAANLIDTVHDATVQTLRSRLGARNDAANMVSAIRSGSISLTPGMTKGQHTVSVIIGVSTMTLSPTEVNTIIRVFTDNGAAPNDVDYMESKWMLVIRVYDVNTQGESPTDSESAEIKHRVLMARPAAIAHLSESLDESPTLSWRAVIADLSILAKARLAQAAEIIRSRSASRQ